MSEEERFWFEKKEGVSSLESLALRAFCESIYLEKIDPLILELLGRITLCDRSLNLKKIIEAYERLVSHRVLLKCRSLIGGSVEVRVFSVQLDCNVAQFLTEYRDKRLGCPTRMSGMRIGSADYLPRATFREMTPYREMTVHVSESSFL